MSEQRTDEPEKENKPVTNALPLSEPQTRPETASGAGLDAQVMERLDSIEKTVQVTNTVVKDIREDIPHTMWEKLKEDLRAGAVGFLIGLLLGYVTIYLFHL